MKQTNLGLDTFRSRFLCSNTYLLYIQLFNLHNFCLEVLTEQCMRYANFKIKAFPLLLRFTLSSYMIYRDIQLKLKLLTIIQALKKQRMAGVPYLVTVIYIFVLSLSTLNFFTALFPKQITGKRLIMCGCTIMREKAYN